MVDPIQKAADRTAAEMAQPDDDWRRRERMKPETPATTRPSMEDLRIAARALRANSGSPAGVVRVRVADYLEALAMEGE